MSAHETLKELVDLIKTGRAEVCIVGASNWWERAQLAVDEDIDDEEARTRAYEAQGMSRSDAQGAVEADDMMRAIDLAEHRRELREGR